MKIVMTIALMTAVPFLTGCGSTSVDACNAAAAASATWEKELGSAQGAEAVKKVNAAYKAVLTEQAGKADGAVRSAMNDMAASLDAADAAIDAGAEAGIDAAQKGTDAKTTALNSACRAG
ncbi:hypothetical protein ACIBIZ_37885 [Nonomuraea spiralis]|uniref:hypothetical protein n=1 Tax=Nonomuraea TaxID=83681 RepID=UPI000F7BB11C|nr:hypothetical protein [Nonomuraea sp. WAC 01424]RSN15575.1 hypothetical protein DMB42_01760 [Nonomuraea sp. WAC 01424]